MMKRTFFIITAIIGIAACENITTSKVKNSNVVKVQNGMGKEDTVRYSCEKYIASTSLLNKIINEATEKAKGTLKNPLSFIPRSIKLSVYPEDSFYYYSSGKRIENCKIVKVEYNAIGKSIYGTEGEANSSSIIFLVDTTIERNLIDNIRLQPLQIEDGSVNRLLTLNDYNGNGSLEVQPIKNTECHLIVVSTASCVDKGTYLYIHFDDETKIQLKNWNDFNCKGTAYYKLTSKEIEQLKTKKVSHIGFWYDGDNSQLAKVPFNEQDYLMQFAKLVSK